MKFSILTLLVATEALPLHKEMGIDLSRVLVGEHNADGICQAASLPEGYLENLGQVGWSSASLAILCSHTNSIDSCVYSRWR